MRMNDASSGYDDDSGNDDGNGDAAAGGIDDIDDNDTYQPLFLR